MMNVHDVIKIITDILKCQYGIDIEEKYISQTISSYNDPDIIISKKDTLGLVDDKTGNVIRTVREIKTLDDTTVNCIRYKYNKYNNISEVVTTNVPGGEDTHAIIHNDYYSNGKLSSSILDDDKFKSYGYSSDKLTSMVYHNGTFEYFTSISYSNNGEYCTINISDSANRKCSSIRILMYFKKRKFSGDGWDMVIEAYVLRPGYKNIRIHVENDIYAYNTNYNHGNYYYRKPIAIKYNFSAGINTVYNGYINFMIPVNLLSKK